MVQRMRVVLLWGIIDVLIISCSSMRYRIFMSSIFSWIYTNDFILFTEVPVYILFISLIYSLSTLTNVVDF